MLLVYTKEINVIVKFNLKCNVLTGNKFPNNLCVLPVCMRVSVCHYEEIFYDIYISSSLLHMRH